MHVVTVDLHIAAEHVAAFECAMLANARASLEREPGCRQFDVDVDASGRRFFLYELYDDEAAFRAHLATPHFVAFNQEVTPWVIDKSVRAWRRLEA